MKEFMENFNKESTNNESGLPVVYSIENIRDDILTLYFQQVRTIGWIGGTSQVSKLLNISENEALLVFDPDITAKDLNITYKFVSSMEFAKSIEYMFQYAYYGSIDVSYEALTNESIHTWVAAILTDMANSRVAEEWESYAADVIAPAKRCLEVAELAVARSILEGTEDMAFYFSGKNKEDEIDSDFLTVRQMALLAGMEEMSIRAAANPKRANPLQTISVDGRTRISVDAAKNWLVSKGRYVPMKRIHPSEGVDLQKHQFKSLEDLLSLIFEQIRILETKNEYETILSNQEIFDLFSSKECLENAEKIKSLASSIKLDLKLLILKIREALVNEELANVEAELREISK